MIANDLTASEILEKRIRKLVLQMVLRSRPSNIIVAVISIEQENEGNAQAHMGT